MSDIFTEYERGYYLIGDKFKPVPLHKNEFVNRGNSFTNFTDKIKFLGKLIGYSNPDDFNFHDFIDHEKEFEDENDNDNDNDETEY